MAGSVLAATKIKSEHMQKDTFLYLSAGVGVTALACWFIPKMMGLSDTDFWIIILFMMLGIMAQSALEAFGFNRWIGAFVFIFIFSTGLIGAALLGANLFG